jgi:hypothetical protein
MVPSKPNLTISGVFDEIEFLDHSATSEGWHVQWETVPQGQESEPRSLGCIRRETKRMKPTDKAILGMVSESLGRNASEPRGGLDKEFNPKAEPSMVGRRLHGVAQSGVTRHVTSAGW